jgi:hypothetical protein
MRGQPALASARHLALTDAGEYRTSNATFAGSRHRSAEIKDAMLRLASNHAALSAAR